MKKIGFVHRIKENEGYCFIRVPNERMEYFSHVRDFDVPDSMRLGQYVSFTPIPVPGKNPAATNVIAIAA